MNEILLFRRRRAVVVARGWVGGGEWGGAGEGRMEGPGGWATKMNESISEWTVEETVMLNGGAEKLIVNQVR